MATRFYLSDAIPAGYTFAYDAGWEYTNAATTKGSRRMWPWRNAFEITSNIQSETTTINAQDGLLAQFVSPALSAQTITGTVAGAFFVREDNAGANMISQFTARVVAPDGTVRGTLVAMNTTTTVSNEWLASTSGFRSARFPSGSNGTTVTSVSAQAGDFIVVEVGFRALNTGGTFSGTMRWGGGLLDADVPQNDTTTADTQANPWIEFSQNLTFLAPATVHDSIASAPDVMPAPLADVEARTADFTALTFAAGEPDELEAFDLANPHVGWLKLVGDTTAASLSIWIGAGIDIFPYLFVYDEVPTDSSLNVGLYAYYEVDGGPLQINVPAGETWYLAVYHTNHTPFSADRNIEVLVRRTDAGPPVGDIKDNIADAVDRFPASIGTELVSETTNLAAFTTEADDPTEISTYSGRTLNYTGWLKLVVPTTAQVTISLDPDTQPEDLTFWLYDETPTASSVAIHFSDNDDLGAPFPYDWPRFSEILLPAGTYYLCVAPWQLNDWTGAEGGQVSVRVRWEFPAVIETFNVNSVIKRTIFYRQQVSVPQIRGVSTASTSTDQNQLLVPIPTEAQPGDCLVCYVGTRDQTVSASESGWFRYESLGAAGSPARRLTVFAFDSSLTDGDYEWTGVGTELTLTWAGSPSPAVAVMVALSPIGSMPWDSLMGVSGPSSTLETPYIQYLSSNTDFGAANMALGAFVGDGAGTWSVLAGSHLAPATEIATVSTTGVSLHLQRREDIFDSLVESFRAGHGTSVAAVTSLLLFVAETGRFRLRARIQPGGLITLNAVLQAVFHTTHPRTGPHVHQTPSDFVVLSQALPDLLAGSTLTDTLSELDARITDLEKGNP